MPPIRCTASPRGPDSVPICLGLITPPPFHPVYQPRYRLYGSSIPSWSDAVPLPGALAYTGGVGSAERCLSEPPRRRVDLSRSVPSSLPAKGPPTATASAARGRLRKRGSRRGGARVRYASSSGPCQRLAAVGVSPNGRCTPLRACGTAVKSEAGASYFGVRARGVRVTGVPKVTTGIVGRAWNVAANVCGSFGAGVAARGYVEGGGRRGGGSGSFCRQLHYGLFPPLHAG